MKLETRRLILKPHTLNNLNKISKWVNDSRLLFMNDDQPEPYIMKSKSDTEAMIKRFVSSTPGANKDIIHFAIYKKINEELIGYCMIAFIDDYHRRCKFGITIGEVEEWGKGYGKEVLREIMRYCFESLNMNRVGAEIYSHNLSSIKLFEGVGFKKEGTIRESVLKNGQYVDEYLYGLLKSEWDVVKDDNEY